MSILIYPQKDLKKILVLGAFVGFISLFLVQGGISSIISGTKLNIDESLNLYILTSLGLFSGYIVRNFWGSSKDGLIDGPDIIQLKKPKRTIVGKFASLLINKNE